MAITSNKSSMVPRGVASTVPRGVARTVPPQRATRPREPRAGHAHSLPHLRRTIPSQVHQAALPGPKAARTGTEARRPGLSLYKHVADKDDLLDAMVDLVVGEIELPGMEADWRQSMRLRAKTAFADRNPANAVARHKAMTYGMRLLTLDACAKPLYAV